MNYAMASNEATRKHTLKLTIDGIEHDLLGYGIVNSLQMNEYDHSNGFLIDRRLNVEIRYFLYESQKEAICKLSALNNIIGSTGYQLETCTGKYIGNFCPNHISREMQPGGCMKVEFSFMFNIHREMNAVDEYCVDQPPMRYKPRKRKKILRLEDETPLLTKLLKHVSMEVE